MSDDIRTEARSLLDGLPSWGDGPNWCDPSGQSIPIPKVTLRRLLNYILTDVEALREVYDAARDLDPLATCVGQGKAWDRLAAAFHAVESPAESQPLRPMADETTEPKGE